MGSLSFAILISRWTGLPAPKEQSSLNPGAGNLVRLGHKRLALLVLLGDSMKAIIPLWIAKSLGFSEGQLAWLVFVACLGHMFPIFFHLRGGKGVATALGGLLVVSWPVAGIALGIWFSVFIVCRYAALASLAAISSVLFSAGLLCPTTTHMPIALIVGILLASHSSNWTRLWKGTEPRIHISDHL
jgi:glycerol-3-phosphate acyltransferase PlsY